MKKNVTYRIISALLAMTTILSLTFSFLPINASAAANDPVVVVSLGDSFSSGEGVEPFYGQDKPLPEKVKDEDWLAHRSTKSWPAQIEIPNIAGTMKDYKYGESKAKDCIWYFKASSGAETIHFKNKQKKMVVKNFIHADEMWLDPQLDVFENIPKGTVDYVTLTIGGNDMGFVDVIAKCAAECSYLHFDKKKATLKGMMIDKWGLFYKENDGVEIRLRQTYKDIEEAAGKQATILVAGYPKLFNKRGYGNLINIDEATIVNENVSLFNDRIEAIVTELRNEGMNIHFVDVETKFEGHEAYSWISWINWISPNEPGDENVEDFQIDNIMTAISAYSMHPNKDGTKAYAECVNAKIEELEEAKKPGVAPKPEIPDQGDEDAKFEIKPQLNSIGAGWDLTIALKNDGTVKVYGYYLRSEQETVRRWTDIVSVDSGAQHVVGLKSDGTVVAAGFHKQHQCDVETWTDIVAISAGDYSTLGLRSDGTVVGCGNDTERVSVQWWRDIVAIDAGWNHSVGVKNDGTVVACGKNEYGECDVELWTDIVSVSAGRGHTVGLRSDGTVVATGDNQFGQCNVSDWTDIVSVCAGWGRTIGLKSDGTIVVVGEYGRYPNYFENMSGFDEDPSIIASWTDIVAISANAYFVDALRADGTVLTTSYREQVVGVWNDIKIYSRLGSTNPNAEAKGLAYQVNDDGKTCTVTGIGSFTGKVLNIPESIDGYKVTAIGYRAFKDCKNLLAATLPDTITEIGAGAFYMCTNLSKIQIPNSVKTIGGGAFEHCWSLEKVTIPKGVTEIRGSTFCYCKSLKEVTIPEGVTIIGMCAFGGCESLTKVTIPESVTSIVGAAFEHCSNLQEINIPKNITVIEVNLFRDCVSLKEIRIPDKVTTINGSAFYGCTSLKEIRISANVSVIDGNPFAECRSLTTITVDAGNRNFVVVDGMLFNKDKTSLIACPAGITKDLISIPASVETIGTSAFSGCDKISEIVMTDKVITIGEYAFWYCTNLEKIVLSENISKIDRYTFCACSSLTELVIPSGVVDIDGDAIRGCSSLTTITIPSSVQTIGYAAFYNCTNLAELHFLGTTSQWQAITKGSSWDKETGNYIVRCTDGTLSK